MLPLLGRYPRRHVRPTVPPTAEQSGYHGWQRFFGNYETLIPETPLAMKMLNKKSVMLTATRGERVGRDGEELRLYRTFYLLVASHGIEQTLRLCDTRFGSVRDWCFASGANVTALLCFEHLECVHRTGIVLQNTLWRCQQRAL